MNNNLIFNLNSPLSHWQQESSSYFEYPMHLFIFLLKSFQSHWWLHCISLESRFFLAVRSSFFQTVSSYLYRFRQATLSTHPAPFLDPLY